MSEAEYFEQFTGDVDAEIADSIPAFSRDCPDCHGTGFKQIKSGLIILEMPCYRCFDKAGR